MVVRGKRGRRDATLKQINFPFDPVPSFPPNDHHHHSLFQDADPLDVRSFLLVLLDGFVRCSDMGGSVSSLSLAIARPFLLRAQQSGGSFVFAESESGREEEDAFALSGRGWRGGGG